MCPRSAGWTLVSLACLGSVMVCGAAEPKAAAKHAALSDAWPAPETVDPRGRPHGQIHDKPARFYVFRLQDQWHVLSTSQHVKHFRGTISVDQGVIKAAVPVGKEKVDSIRLTPSHKQIKFDLKTGKAADGFYFVVSPETQRIKFDLNPGGAKKPRNHVFVGQAQVHPSRCPFVLKANEFGAPAKAESSP